MGTERIQPWYREPWPWILMAGPAAVVAAGLVTAWIAFHGADGLVADDYYKRGLAINDTLLRSAAAERLGVHAELRITGNRLRVMLGNTVSQGTLSLHLVHPTRMGMDQRLELSAIQPGIYEGQLQALRPGRWHVALEARDWRLTGDWTLPAAGKLVLGGPAPALAADERTKGDKQ